MSLSDSFEKAAKPVVSFRMSTGTDVMRLLAFYEENPHPDIYKRDPEDVKNNIAAGRAIIVEKDGDIIMSSIGYDFKNPDTELVKPKWTEFGSTLCKAEDRGLGLYPFIIAAQTVHEFLNRPPEEFFMGAIAHSAEGVFKMLHDKVGWESFMPSEELLHIADLHKDINHYYCLRATTQTLPQQARLVDVFMDKATVAHKKTQEEHILDFSRLPLANELRPALEELSYGGFGAYFEGNEPIPLGEARMMMIEDMPGGPTLAP